MFEKQQRIVRGTKSGLRKNKECLMIVLDILAMVKGIKYEGLEVPVDAMLVR